MANNRLYVVDTSTNEYLCIAKGWGCGWNVGNIDLYTEFMFFRTNDADETNLIVGTEADDEFYEKWIVNGQNFNSKNKWEYNEMKE